MAKVSANLKAKFPSEDVEYVGAPVVSLDSVQHSADAEAKQLASASVVKAGVALQKPVESKVAVAKIGSQVADPSAPDTNTQKKIWRAERFGVPVLLSEQEKRNSRAERFGIGSGTVKSEELKRKARAERFGLAVSSSVVNEEAKKKARLERFSTNAKSVSNEEDKRKARAARFSNVSSSLSEANSKAAVAGGASGGA